MSARLSIAACLIAAVASGCDAMNERAATAPTVEDVDDNPTAYAGKRVTLTGEIDEVHSNRAFELKGHGWVFEDEILVLTRNPVRLGPAQLADDTMVQIKGIVRKMSAAEIEREVGWDIEDPITARWNEQAVVIADDISALASLAHWSEKDDPTGAVVSLWTIYEAPMPADYAGAAIRLERVEVADKSKEGMFVGFGGSPDIFAAAPAAGALDAIKEGQHVTIAGTLKTVPSGAGGMPEQWKLSKDQSDRLSQDALYIEASDVKALPDEKPVSDETAAKQ